jgi:hypothetical protein
MPMFASKTVAAHMLRGVIAAALITWAVMHQWSHPAFAVAASVMAIVAMRGCPLCWTLGLLETIGESIRRLRDDGHMPPRPRRHDLEGSRRRTGFFVLPSWFSCFRGCICSSTTREVQ